MKRASVQRNRGFITQAVILIVIILIVLGYFRIDIKNIATSPDVQDNLQYAWHLIVTGFLYLKNETVDFILTYFPAFSYIK